MGEGLEAPKGRQVARVHNGPLRRPYWKDSCSGLVADDHLFTTSCCHVRKCQGCGKGNHHQPFSRGDPRVRVTICPPMPKTILVYIWVPNVIINSGSYLSLSCSSLGNKLYDQTTWGPISSCLSLSTPFSFLFCRDCIHSRSLKFPLSRIFISIFFPLGFSL